MEIAKTPNVAAVAAQFDIAQPLTKVIAQDPSSVRNGKVIVTFKPNEMPGDPDALKLDGAVYPIVRQIVPFNPGNGAAGGHLYFKLELPEFAKEGDYQASIRSRGAWLPIILKVLIAQH